MDTTTTRFNDGTYTVQPHGNALLARHAAAFVNGLIPLARTGLRLEIDLSRVTQMDSAGVGALVTCRHALQREGCEMVLTQVERRLSDELRSCGLQQLLTRHVDDVYMAF